MGQVVSIEPPTAGLNARDSVDGLQPNEALVLENWVPDVGYMRSRGGSAVGADLGSGAPVETLISFEAGPDTRLLAVSDLTLYDLTDAANIQTLTPETALTANRLQYAIFTDLNGNQRCILTGDYLTGTVPQEFNAGAGTVTDLAVTGTGLTPSNLFSPLVFKGRLMYADRTKLSLWYAQAGSLAGELTEFPLGSVFQRGGEIRHLFTWSKDTGAGMDDLLGIMTTTGEVLIYQGDDPDDALGWELVQRYNLPRPIDADIERMGAETFYASEDGYVNLSQAIAEGVVNDYGLFSGKISRLVKDAVARYKNNRGWRLLFYPRGSLFLANVPIQENRNHIQHVMNTRNGAWTTFKGWNACCLVVHEGQLLFGRNDGRVILADRGVSDLGDRIECVCITAYTGLGDPSRKKQATAMTILTNHKVPKAFNLDALADFADTRRLPPIRYVAEKRRGQWNVSKWDQDYWATDDRQVGGTWYRRPVRADGYNIAFVVRQASRAQQIIWYSSSVEFKFSGRK